MSISEAVQGICSNLGVTRVLEALSRRDCLAVLGYHRVGTTENTVFDTGVVGLTPEELDQHITALKRRYRIVTLQEAVEFVLRPAPGFGTGILITFDDGYADTHAVAYPILRAHSVQATFFLSTSFVGTCNVPWWDQIAFMLRQTRRTRLELSYPPMKFDFEVEDRKAAIRRLLRIYKSEPIDLARLLDSLREATQVSVPNNAGLFLNWEQVSEMLAGGMAFGSHGHGHEILAKLPPERQYEDLSRSRAILAEKLKVEIDTLSFPVGGSQAFSAETITAAQRAGYRVAFSYYGGVNFPGRTNPFDIHRIRPLAPSGQLRFQIASALFTGNSS